MPFGSADSVRFRVSCDLFLMNRSTGETTRGDLSAYVILRNGDEQMRDVVFSMIRTKSVMREDRMWAKDGVRLADFREHEAFSVWCQNNGENFREVRQRMENRVADMFRAGVQNPEGNHPDM